MASRLYIKTQSKDTFLNLSDVYVVRVSSLVFLDSFFKTYFSP